MRRFFLNGLSLSLLAAILLASCGGNDPSDPGSQVPGILSGRVYLSDEYGRRLSDHSGAVVAILGTSYSTTTDAEGYWRFENLPVGTYIVRYMKDGFAERRMYNVSYTGNGHRYLYELEVYRLPSYSVTTLRGYVTDTVQQHLEVRVGDTLSGYRDSLITKVITVEKRVVFEGEIDQSVPGEVAGCVAIAVGRDALVSKESGRFTSMIDCPVEGGGTRFSRTIPLNTFAQQNALSAGAHIYAVAYPAAPAYMIYDDPEMRTPIVAYASPNASPMVDFVLQ